MKNGEVNEFGGPQELILKPNGAYTALVQIQEKTPASKPLILTQYLEYLARGQAQIGSYIVLQIALRVAYLA